MDRVLLIGSGGRESALAWKIKQSPLLKSLRVYPGNGGFELEEIWREKIDLKDKDSVQETVRKGNFNFVVVGPEEPLVDGITDWLNEMQVPCFGPSAYCAQIEGSKNFAKELMVASNVPTAEYQTFTEYESAKKFTASHAYPLVVKADGLAAGKGVTVCATEAEADSALKDIFLDKKFGNSGVRVVIEEFMKGEEVSVFAITDGSSYMILPPAQDHKRAFDGDQGPNTGGMGAYCPAPIATSKVLDKTRTQIIEPILKEFQKRKKPYRGLLYAGLMVQNEEPRVVEFNCRFGDPETQAILPLLEMDLLPILYQSACGKLEKYDTPQPKNKSVYVVMAAEGYPGDYKKNIEILVEESSEPETFIFHAGTKKTDDEKILSNGGRVLGVGAVRKSIKEAQASAYQRIQSIRGNGLFYRTDIASKAVE